MRLILDISMVLIGSSNLAVATETSNLFKKVCSFARSADSAKVSYYLMHERQVGN